MKKKLFMLLALVMTAMTASAYDLTVGTSEHGTITFKIDGTTATSANENDVVTVEITPDAGYVVNQPSGQWIAAMAKAPRRAASIDLLKDVDLTPVTGQENQWQFTMKRANVEISATYKKLLTNTDITVQDIAAVTYNGQAQEPTVTVKDGTTTLVLNTDYTVSYSNNTNAALSTAATAPTVTITAVSTSEKYAGTTSKTFSIEKKALTVTADNKTATYGDEAPEYTVTYDGFVGNETETVLGGTLALSCDYVKNQSGVGEYTITPSGLTSSNYEITFAEGTLTVSAKALEDAFIADIAAVTYNGQAQTPAPVLTFNGMTLAESTDYTLAYENNVNAGTATVTATGKGNYSGTASTTFAINKAALTVTADNKTATYGDEAPEYTVTYDGFVNNETNAVLGGTLALACDYVKNQSGVGEYTITPSGLTSSDYEITFVDGTLTVSKKALEDGFIADIDALTYTGAAQTPEPVVTFNGMTLVKDEDYTVAYTDNTNVAAATATTGAPTVTIAATDASNYSGTASVTFSIEKKALTVTADNKTATYGDEAPEYTVTYDGFVSNETETVLGGTLDLACDYVKNQSGVGEYTITPSGLTSSNYEITFAEGTLTVSAKALEDAFIADIAAVTYNGQAQTPEPVVTFKGMTLAESTDYTLAYENNVNAGTATVTATGTGNYSGTASKTFTINPAALTTATLQETNFTYNQQEQTAQVATVTAGTLTVPAEGYDVTDNTATNVGNYTATITGKGNYTGEVKAQFSIIAADANLFELTLVPTEFTYNSQEQKPTVTVHDGSAVLTEGTDYTLAYENNVNAGTATVTATGKGNYTGTQVKTFEIKKADITPTAPTALELTYNGQAQTLISAGSAEGGEMQYSLDGQSWVTTLPQGTDAGDYTVYYRVVGDANHNDVAAQTLQMTIGQAELTAASLKETIFLCNEQEQTAEVSTVSASELTVPATDYEVAGNSATEVGTYTVTVTGKGNFTGEVTAEFTILRDMSKVFADGNGWATYVAREDLALPDGVTAYVVTGATATVVKAEAIQYIPKGVGILLNRADVANADYKAAVYTGETAETESMLVGSATESSELTAYQDFVLYRDEFVLSSTTTAEAGRAYLPAVLTPAGAPCRSIVIDSEMTGINVESRMKTEESAAAEWYDLNGHKLQGTPTKKGVYILNGKKVVVK